MIDCPQWVMVVILEIALLKSHPERAGPEYDYFISWLCG